MSTSESLEAPRRDNPRTKAGYAQSVQAAAQAVDARIAGAAKRVERRNRRRLVGVSAVGGSLAAAAAATLFLTIGSPSGGPGVENASAAVKSAASRSAVSAEQSGIAVVQITHGGKPWAGTTVRWHGQDVAVAGDFPLRRRKAGAELLVVRGIVYGLDPRDGGWTMQGTPENIDPGSGTTPAEYLAAVREDVGGVTLRRFAAGVSGLATRPLGDGSTVYSGTVAAGQIARESGFKEGQPIRVFPFGYVAHDEAADPSALLDASVTVGPDGLVREIAVTWGAGASAWAYNVTYRGLGATPALVAPQNARPLRDRVPAAPPS